MARKRNQRGRRQVKRRQNRTSSWLRRAKRAVYRPDSTASFPYNDFYKSWKHHPQHKNTRGKGSKTSKLGEYHQEATQAQEGFQPLDPQQSTISNFLYDNAYAPVRDTFGNLMQSPNIQNSVAQYARPETVARADQIVRYTAHQMAQNGWNPWANSYVPQAVTGALGAVAPFFQQLLFGGAAPGQWQGQGAIAPGEGFNPNAF